jgi:methylenetetrahydrofolate reductase (NADPH)
MQEKRSNIRFVTYETKERSPKETFISHVMLFLENVIKIPVFQCKRCGECILSHTALICSQRCPKRLRNGPCGGTREGGYCEVYSNRRCIWYLIYCRAKLLKRISFLRDIEKIHNWELEKTSSWLNVVKKRIEPPRIFYRRKSNS